MKGLIGSTLRFGAPGGPWVHALLFVAFAAVAWLGVRQTARVAVRRRRLALAALRVTTALSALLFTLQPRFVVQRVQRIEGRLAVLVDASQSMAVRDLQPSRAARALELLRTFRQESKLPFDLFVFGADARSVKLEDLDARRLTMQDDTRIGAAIEHVAKELGDELGAMLVLSDGADHVPGWSPSQLKSLGVRVDTLAVAGEEELVDDAILSVKADAVAFLHQAAQVEVEVRSTRTPRAPLTVTLREDGKLVAEATVELDAEGRGKSVLPFTPARIGRAVYSLSLPLAEGDMVPENNERAFLLRVVRDKLRVLLLCGAPTWDTRFLRAFLKADPSIDLITFFILRTSSDLTMASADELSLIPFPTDELFREHLDSFDIVIFQDFNYGPYQVGAYLPRIRDYVVKGGAFAMIGGNRAFGAGGYEHTPIAEILPVRIAPGAAAVSEAELQPVLAQAMARHPIVELVPDPEENAKSWAELAPLLGVNKLQGAREGAQVLLTHPRESGTDGQPMPVLTVGTAGQGRVLAFTADSSWRWSITTAGRRGDASAYDRFWDHALRWLARDPRLDPAHVETDRERYGPEAQIGVKMRLRDERYAPLAERDVDLAVMDFGGALLSKHSVHSDAQGEASATITGPVSPGAYGIVVRDGSTVLAEQGFIVEAGGEELADPRPRPELLRAIASATSGHFHRSADPPKLDALDRTRARSLGAVTSTPLDSPWFVALLLAALGLEWALRRAWGLR
ncbi:MAG: glutamine amidotransferase [Polyangiales bacterium]